MKLSELKQGQSAMVVAIHGLTSDVRKKLMVMGILPNTSVRLIRRAPMGDPLQIEARGVSLAVREKIAEAIEVECQ
ncbi:ferrous iron transport protein A [Vibrio vulnificus]|uniref:Ferrous iron transport protein A n=1 Tax=Vibrio vulnificus (strain CMCP6) TaxID=216895 RepID=A0A3Q0L1J0_VIBVU|nr:FeoA family protein [Vibrio vulnificus]AAO08687.1 Ferrous iron transport protein A [Vibrio vulnificus CMCP6]EGR0055587.1 ferrous iron transport protein A [Vibrio vulnificus]EGR0788759.1 ferrous iron transport protein A [Vibrio vulnificus]EGR0796933.1 ferrous iron transport protein A [Vibrio vulnificus]EGR0813728.1 ferrous iron transport protein A [Vibrio vulnificus]